MSQFDFIFMLTRNDRTVEDAATHLETALRAGVGHIGFKDIGLPFDDLARLARRIKDAGARAYIEVVSVDRESELRSVRAAVDLGVDFLLGGTHVDPPQPFVTMPLTYERAFGGPGYSHHCCANRFLPDSRMKKR